MSKGDAIAVMNHIMNIGFTSNKNNNYFHFNSILLSVEVFADALTYVEYHVW